MKRRSFLGLLAAAAVAAGIRPSRASAPEPAVPAPDVADVAVGDPIVDLPSFAWQGIPFRVDPDCPEDVVFFVNMSGYPSLYYIENVAPPISPLGKRLNPWILK